MTLNTGHIPPEAFTFLDRENFIQNSEKIPILYHIARRPNVKSIVHGAEGLDPNLLRYSTALGNVMGDERNYWWKQ